jgi:S-(hydroxymethyl)glutathione dehydrogenase/alcohol dehydrogenase
MTARDGTAALGQGDGSFAFAEIVEDDPGPGEVRVRLAAAGLCHTDVASLRWPGPLVLGHEGAGHVDAVGPGVEGFASGMPVLLNWAIPCRHCEPCTRGDLPLCDRTLESDPDRYGTSRSHAGATLLDGEAIRRSFNLGTFSAYAVVRAEALVRLPDWLAPDRACVLGCGVMTGVGSVLNIAGVRAGETVGVMGCGGVGLNAIQGARIAGASRIVAIDRVAERLELATALGATDTILVSGDEPDRLIEEVRDRTARHGLDYMFEATGQADLAFLPLRLVRNGGTVLQLSGSHGVVGATMTDFFWNKRYLTPLYGGCVPERDFPRLFDWVRSGDIDLALLTSRSYGLADLGEAIDDLLAGRTVKPVLRLAS